MKISASAMLKSDLQKRLNYFISFALCGLCILLQPQGLSRSLTPLNAEIGITV